MARIRATASAGPARFSCCLTSPRCTACRRTRSSPPGTCPGCGGMWPPLALPLPSVRWRRAWAAGHEASHEPPGRRSGRAGRGSLAGQRPARRPAGRPACRVPLLLWPPGAQGTGMAGGGPGRAGLFSSGWVVPRAEFRSYYGRPVLKEPVWRAPDVPGYLFLGGLAGASSLLGACTQLAGNRELSRAAKTGAAGAIGLSAVALVHDLGRPERFVNMLRVFKVTSPMSVGSWLLAGYGPAAGAAAACALTGRLPRAGTAATIGAAVLAPGVATYTAALLCDTAVPAWHEGHREMP